MSPGEKIVFIAGGIAIIAVMLFGLFAILSHWWNEK